MIIPDSEKSGSSVRSGSGRSPSFGPVDDPPSPPPYSATIASSDDHYQSADSPRSPNFHTTSTRANLPPRCNHLIDRKTFSSVSGTWHVDTALEIPESLLPPLTEFDGRWNREAQQARKSRTDELRRRQEWSPRSDRPAPIVETRPNLMLGATNGTISGDVHVVSSDGLARQAIIVAEGCNGSISLRIHAPQHQLLRVFASSTNGSVNIKIPSSFEGAIVMSTSWGSANISPAIKAKLTTFSTTPNSSRGFVGNWEAQGFGTNDDPPLPAEDPFSTWTGPLIDISSTNGAVNLSFIEEEADSVTSHFARAFQGFMGGWFGRGRQGENVGCGGPPVPPMFTPPPPPMFHPSPPPMFFPPPPGAWPGMNPVKSPGVGGLDLD